MSYTAEWTGPTQSLLMLLRHLPAAWEKSVVLPGRGPFCAQLEEEKVRSISVSSLDKWRIPELRRLIIRDRFDLVYGNNTSGACRNAFVAAKCAGVPFICHVRAIVQRGEWRKFGFLRFADAVVAVSEACARSVSGYVHPKRLHVVYNGVEVLERDRRTEATAAGPEEQCSEARLVGVAHVKRRKGQLYAVRAMALITRAVPSARLLLIGSLDRDPPYVQEIRELIRRRGLEEHVSLLGFRPDVGTLMEDSDIFLHTATEDPHPRAVLEAMACGVPVVAFDVDGVGETVASGCSGYLVPVGDTDELAAMTTKLLEDPQLRREFGISARRRAEERFSAEATAREVRRIIERTLHTPRSPTGEGREAMVR